MYDITIIGAGVSSVFLAYKLQEQNKNLTIHIIDKGKPLEDRVCPTDHGGTCNCKACPKYYGFAGLGKSEGKFNYTNDFGGQLGDKIGEQEALELMDEVDRILCSYGADQIEAYSTQNPDLEREAKTYGLDVLSTSVRHLGTKLATNIFQKLFDDLKDFISFTFEADVQAISESDKGFSIQTNHGSFHSTKVVLATGMSGSEWMQKQCTSLGIQPSRTRVDLGLRIEMNRKQMNPLLQHTFETKLRYRGKDYEATTYCMNPGGRIIRKHQSGLVMADGQNYGEKNEQTKNLNYSLFVPRYFNTYEEARTYSRSIIEGVNQEKGRIVVQRLGDLYKQQASTQKGIEMNSIRPSLAEIEPGNLINEMPELYLRAYLDMTEALEGLIGEKLNEDTLLYAMDAKFYEPKVETNKTFESNIPNLFLVGDCSGDTHSLSQAAASGLFLGKYLSNVEDKQFEQVVENRH
ncbi:NAD(P)/FAD-dependent oxidoreductase [Pontibacillus marinus]|uniref:NAD(FAD)-utilizing dehydrogenase n=1 Tax=Pontibacillus marinus BH030004 = DSM 16465 TaxID=1385511 RepID=A0A0A5GI72_9BACI|nr:NAD(FAD)-utilizing dehydrogenase [Pontibacillus marinus]KGX90825.1 NAD(FAD)-utilizing dehydrogenase [Pontibacillus marinus BH030004 = DSM 16465]